jgi:hypothetical protein
LTISNSTLNEVGAPCCRSSRSSIANVNRRSRSRLSDYRPDAITACTATLTIRRSSSAASGTKAFYKRSFFITFAVVRPSKGMRTNRCVFNSFH